MEAPAVTEDYQYNSYGSRSVKSVNTGFFTHDYSYTYKDNALSQDINYVYFNGIYKFIPKRDVNGRNTGKVISTSRAGSVIASEQISYRKAGDHATNMPATVWYGSNRQIKDSIKYRYDKLGNITEILENGHTAARYAYDKLNRIIREDNSALNKTTLYTYDQNGNITERCEYAYTWKTDAELSNLKCTHASYDYEDDRLKTYNGENCLYNNLGNPLVYCGKTVEWQYGNRLTKFGNVNFVYDGLGRRIRKNGLQFLYDSENNLIYQSNGLEFIYDTTGVAGLKYKDNVYFYRKDAQGNIIAILDSAGAVVVKYNYDAWGKHNITDADGEPIMDPEHIAYLNPFRYRSYYYDTETRLYYLQTRYYDPEVCRFISQDDIDYAEPEVINGLNLYAYCGNNPVMNVDPTGTFVSTILGLIFGAIWGAISAALNGEDIWKGIAAGAVAGVTNGLVLDLAIAATVLIPGGGGIVVGLVAVGAGGFIAGTLGDAAGQLIMGKESVDWDKAFAVGGITFATNLLSFGISYIAGVASGQSTANLVKMLSPKYTPVWSWIFQIIMGWSLPFFSTIPGKSVT